MIELEVLRLRSPGGPGLRTRPHRPGTAAEPAIAMRVELRRARTSDARAVADLIAPWAAAGVMLPKTPRQLRDAADDTIVAERGGEVVGSVGLRRIDDVTAEVVGLVVSDAAQGTGTGGRLLDAVLDEAAARGHTRIFALTLQPGFFARAGFREGRVTEVPEKIRLDCARCPRRVGCRERMMILERE